MANDWLHNIANLKWLIIMVLLYLQLNDNKL